MLFKGRTFPGAGYRPYLSGLPDKGGYGADSKKAGEQTDERLFVVAEALRRGVPVDVISEKTSIDSYFINKIHGIIRFEKELKRTGIKGMDRAVLQRAKKMGLSDSAIARLIDRPAVKCAK